MDPLLVNVAEGHHIDARVVEEILQVEKDHVYQKSRHTRGPIRQIIAEMSEQEGSDQWFSILFA